MTTTLFSICISSICSLISAISSSKSSAVYFSASSSGKYTCPFKAALCNTYIRPDFILKPASFFIPTFLAISSAILKPTPAISSANLYGLLVIIEYKVCPYSLYILADNFILIPYFCRNIIASDISFFSSICSPIDIAIASLIPFTSDNLSGSFSSICIVSVLNFATILLASVGPKPLKAPEPKYFSISLVPSGTSIV